MSRQLGALCAFVLIAVLLIPGSASAETVVSLTSAASENDHDSGVTVCDALPGNEVTTTVNSLYVPPDTFCTISSTGRVRGEVIVSDGTNTSAHVLNVHGTVNGPIRVVGSTETTGFDTPLVRLFGTARVRSVRATARAAVDTIGPALVRGNIVSDWRIGIFGDEGATIRGNVRGGSGGGIFTDALLVVAPGTEIRGNLVLRGSGNATVAPAGSLTVGRNLLCRGSGTTNITSNAVEGRLIGCP